MCSMSRPLAIAILCVILGALACRRRDEERTEFARSLRCGMTREEVTRLARKLGYDPSDAGWMSRSTSKQKELTLLDLTFRDGRLVALREGHYDPRTKRTEHRTVDLCRDRLTSATPPTPPPRAPGRRRRRRAHRGERGDALRAIRDPEW